MAQPANEKGIVLEGVRKEFPGGVVAVDDVSFDVADGEFLVLVGPSGCGKSTTLRMVAGLEEVGAGTIHIGGRLVTNEPPRSRDIAMVFQNYALYAHMKVRHNIGFGLKMAGKPKAEIQRKVQEAAEILGIVELLDRKPAQLSGGQRQRVAMGRAIVREPAAFLMDEPLSNLDAKLRVEMRAEITTLQRRVSTPTLYVTHDQIEAMTVGDRVAILREGRLEQLGSPKELYERPANTFVAGFIGSPAMNLLRAELRSAGDGLELEFCECRVPLGAETIARHPGLTESAGRDVILGIRPEDTAVAAHGGQDAGSALRIDIVRTESLGSELITYFRPAHGYRPYAGRDAEDASASTVAEDDGSQVPEARRAAGHGLLVGRLDRLAAVEDGSETALNIDPDRLYLFDPETGAAL